MNSKFDAIRPFHDDEVNTAIQSIMHDPMMNTVMQFTYPEKTEAERADILTNIHSTQAFQGNVAYFALQKILFLRIKYKIFVSRAVFDKNQIYIKNLF